MMPEKTEAPLCPVFGTCGGCQYQDIAHGQELSHKAGLLKQVLRTQVSLDDVVFQNPVPSPRIYHYRNRLDLKLVHRRNGDVHVGFSPGGRGPVIEINACPIAMEAVSNFIPQLRRDAAAAIPKKYRMANLVVRCGDDGRVRWGGIGHRSLRLNASDYFFTDILGRRVYYGLDTFFQANLSILPLLMDFLRAQDIWSKDAVFFDLYGGVGLFGMCVNDLVARVVNIEENVHAARLAKYNQSANSLVNVEVREGRVEDILPPILSATPGDGNIVMVDPPRAGLSKEALGFLKGLSRVRHLIYLSCDPESLALNLKVLVDAGWRITVVKPFDFFPRTRHMETLVLLERP